jgi:hypothetical protein
MMVVEIAARQPCPKVATLIHQQQLTAINRCNPGDAFQWLAICPLRKPVIPT